MSELVFRPCTANRFAKASAGIWPVDAAAFGQQANNISILAAVDNRAKFSSIIWLVGSRPLTTPDKLSQELVA